MAKPKYIKDPDKILEYFLAYRDSIKNNPRLREDYVGKDGQRVERQIERPLTIEGFFNYCHENYKVSLEHYWYNSDGSYEEYRSIITRVKNLIREDQIEGGMLGDYNPNLTARLNGLREQTDIDLNQNVSILNIDPLDDSADNSTTKDS